MLRLGNLTWLHLNSVSFPQRSCTDILNFTGKCSKCLHLPSQLPRHSRKPTDILDSPEDTFCQIRTFQRQRDHLSDSWRPQLCCGAAVPGSHLWRMQTYMGRDETLPLVLAEQPSPHPTFCSCSTSGALSGSLTGSVHAKEETALQPPTI